MHSRRHNFVKRIQPDGASNASRQKAAKKHHPQVPVRSRRDGKRKNVRVRRRKNIKLGKRKKLKDASTGKRAVYVWKQERKK